jgi:beta-galactosidase beta subunit
MEKKQTAVEWYANASHELIVKKNNGEITNTDFLIMHHNLFYEAQKMEKEQITDSYIEGHSIYGESTNASQYYNETYGGEDEN